MCSNPFQTLKASFFQHWLGEFIGANGIGPPRTWQERPCQPRAAESSGALGQAGGPHLLSTGAAPRCTSRAVRTAAPAVSLQEHQSPAPRMGPTSLPRAPPALHTHTCPQHAHTQAHVHTPLLFLPCHSPPTQHCAWADPSFQTRAGSASVAFSPTNYFASGSTKDPSKPENKHWSSPSP